MIDTSHAGQHVHIKPGVVIYARAFLPDEEGTIMQEHTHANGGAIITIVKWENDEEIPMYAFEIIASDEVPHD